MRILLIAMLCLAIFGCAATSTAEDITEENNSTVAEQAVETAPPNETIAEPPPVETDTTEEPESNTTEILTSETVFPPEPVFDFNYTDENGTLRVFFFHSPGCSACRDTYPIIQELEGEYPEVSFINYSLATQNGSKAYVKFAELHNLSTQKQMVPQVLVNGTIITDRFNIEEKLEPLLENLTK